MKKIYLLLFALFTFTLFSCKEDKLEAIDIVFENPVNGQQVPLAEAENFEFVITLSADKDLEEFFVRVYPLNDPTDLIVNASRHTHRKEITVRYTRDLSGYPSGTEFKVEVEACVDHDCSGTIEESITFEVI
jgi:hypothetical protein